MNLKTVDFHAGGPLYVGDEEHAPRGWYYYPEDGTAPVPVQVLHPCSCQPLDEEDFLSDQFV